MLRLAVRGFPSARENARQAEARRARALQDRARLERAAHEFAAVIESFAIVPDEEHGGFAYM